MKSNIIHQAFYDLRHQPVIGTVTMIGTALSIFLIMIIVMMHRIEVSPFAPENNRDRLLYGRNLHITGINKHNDSSARLSAALAKRFYDNLAKTECTTIMTSDAETVDVSATGSKTFLAYCHATDQNFWKIFDYEFIAGKPYDEAAVKAGLKEAVIAESVARKLFGSVDVIGREILILQTPYRIVGVVEDASPLAKASFAEVFYPYTVDGGKKFNWDENGEFGPMQAIILANSPDDFEAITEEVRARMKVFDGELRQRGDSLVYHGQPYTQEESGYTGGSNMDSGAAEARKIRWILYAVLLLVPAINLSSMTQSRLRRRVSEIGVRRAFGCRRSRLIRDIIAENFLITLLGGVAGLILCLIFGYFFSDMIFTDLSINREIDLSLKLLIDWKLYGAALAFCFLLNILSSGIPAWRASRINPVDAINSRNI